MNLLIKQFLIVMMLVSGVLNFPIIDGDVSKYQTFGGYLSWPLIELLNLMFGSQATAVKSFIVVLLIVAVVRILYTFNFSLPKINLKLEKYSKPKKTSAIRELKIERQTTDDIAKKINETKNEINRPISDSFIKTILKQKVEEKMEEKRPRSEIKFS